MKTPVAIALALLTCVAAHCGQVSPGFPELKIEGPACSLLGNLPTISPDFQNDRPNGFPAPAAPGATATRVVSHMPIAAPGDVDRKMPVRAPDPGTDYRLAVKTPDVGPAK